MSKTSLTVFLFFALLSGSLLAVKWQGMGSGMNSTVISEIWNGLTPKLDTAVGKGSNAAYQAFAKEISDRLNSRWDPAWNVVLVNCASQYDVILYGYAFRNQWMWYNGIPNSYQTSYFIAALIVWKDFNCRDWKGLRESQTSNFTTTQKATIKAEAAKLNQTILLTDIWGAAFYMMKNILANTEFINGGYSVIMSQDGDQTSFHGYVCRVENKHYLYFYQNTETIDQTGYGNFYLFQTR